MRICSQIKPLGILLLSLATSTPALAVENVNLSGFASLGVGKLNRDDIRFVDYDDEWRIKTDSVIGAQAQMDFDSRWSATTQVIAKGFTFDKTSDFEPTLEWLFASYQLSPETRIRFGRLRTPLYLYSDSLEVGYSYPWVRPPVDTYAFVLSPLSNFNGADTSTIFDLGDSDLDLHVFAGTTHGKYLSFDLDFEVLIGSSLTWRWQNLKLRYGVTAARTDASSTELNPIIDGYRQLSAFDPIFTELADSHSTQNSWFQYHGFGIQWDVDDWTLISEQYVTLGPGRDFSNDAYGWYISISKQIGQFAPYVVAGYYKNIFSDEIETLVKQSENIVPPGANAQLDALRQIDLKVANDFDESGHSYTLGIRYDFHPQAALKIETEYFDSTALLSGDNLKDIKQESVLTSIVIDVVF